jgi:hypothetical protein
MSVLNIAGRTLGMILGLVGAILAFVITLFTVAGRHIGDIVNPGTTGTSHGFLGTVAFIVGLVGALLALPSATVGAVLMLVAGLLMLYVAGAWGVIPLIFLGLGAVLAFLDRGSARA